MYANILFVLLFFFFWILFSKSAWSCSCCCWFFFYLQLFTTCLILLRCNKLYFLKFSLNFLGRYEHYKNRTKKKRYTTFQQNFCVLVFTFEAAKKSRKIKKKLGTNINREKNSSRLSNQTGVYARRYVIVWYCVYLLGKSKKLWRLKQKK